MGRSRSRFKGIRKLQASGEYNIYIYINLIELLLFLVFGWWIYLFIHTYVHVQADVCHAYQILRKGGLKEENIVVFMYDDIAMHEMNPRKGVIINHPQGHDVYAGVPKVPT